MTTYLLDVNVLLALFDPNHVSHLAAHAWFQNIGERAWATCPITENGLVRIAGHPSYPGSPGTPGELRAMLREFCGSKNHHFWPDDVTLLDDTLFSLVRVAHSHVTDVYLLGLSVRKGGKLATFDRHIPAGAVHGGIEALEMIPA